MAVIGIDLGTTYCAAARYVDGRPEIIDLEGDATLPSVVGLQKNGKIVIGRTAKRNQAKFPHNTIVEVKRKMGVTDEKGRPVTVMLGEKAFRPQEISSFILAKIKEEAEASLGEDVSGAVVSCPAYFKDPQRKAIEEAGQLAGLNILRIINEPTAAAYAYGANQDEGDGGEQLYLVYDLGGGTFDVTVIRMAGNNIEVIGTGGDPMLGGGNFDDRIVDWMLECIGEKYPGYLSTLTDEKRDALRLRLKAAAEAGKKDLCDSQDQEPSYMFQLSSVDVFEGKAVNLNERLTKAEFDKRISDLVDKSLSHIEEALKVPREKHGYSEEHITAVLLVGGSTRVPLIQERVARYFEKWPKIEIRGQEVGINPDTIVALGASIVAAEEDPEGDVVEQGKVLVDVTGHTLSVEVRNAETGKDELAPIVEKETPIPCNGAHRFSSAGRGQSQCRIKVYQGEGREIAMEKVTMIGEFMIQIAPIQEPTPLMIGLDLNENGILVAHATDELSGRRVQCQINYQDSTQMDPQELEQKKAQLQAQLNAVIGQTANPLDAGADAAAAGPAPGAAPAPMPGASPGMPAPTAGMSGQMAPTPSPATAPPVPASAQPVDVSVSMNPIMRTLYQRALANFMKVPADRQPALMQLVADIENAARAGDQQKIMAFYPQLTQLMEGVE